MRSDAGFEPVSIMQVGTTASNSITHCATVMQVCSAAAECCWLWALCTASCGGLCCVWSLQDQILQQAAGWVLVAYLDPRAGVLLSPARDAGLQDTPGLGPPADNLPRASIIHDCFDTLKSTLCHHIRLRLSATTPQQATEVVLLCCSEVGGAMPGTPYALP